MISMPSTSRHITGEVVRAFRVFGIEHKGRAVPAKVWASNFFQAREIVAAELRANRKLRCGRFWLEMVL